MISALLCSVTVLHFPQAPSADAKAIDAIAAMRAKLEKAESAKATLEVSVFGRIDSFEFRFLRPNFAKVVSKESAVFQNGSQFFDYSPIDNEYFSRPAPPKGLPTGSAFTFGGLIGLESLGFSNEPEMVPVRYSRKSYNGIPAHEIGLRSKFDPAMNATLWIAQSTSMPLGWSYVLRDFKSSGKIKNLVLNHPLKPSDFAWKPPAGAKRVG